jgi:hypothetical protein
VAASAAPEVHEPGSTLLVRTRLRAQTIHGCPVHPEGADNIYNSIPGVQPLDRFAALMRGKLERPSESHAPHLGSLPAFAGTGLDERPLEFGEPSQDRQYNAWTC